MALGMRHGGSREGFSFNIKREPFFDNICGFTETQISKIDNTQWLKLTSDQRDCLKKNAASSHNNIQIQVMIDSVNKYSKSFYEINCDGYGILNKGHKPLTGTKLDTCPTMCPDGVTPVSKSMCPTYCKDSKMNIPRGFTSCKQLSDYFSTASSKTDSDGTCTTANAKFGINSFKPDDSRKYCKLNTGALCKNNSDCYNTSGCRTDSNTCS